MQSLLAHPGTGSWQSPKSPDLGGPSESARVIPSCRHALVIEQAEAGKRKDSGQDRYGMPDHGVTEARPPAHRRLEEAVRRRSQRWEEQRLPVKKAAKPLTAMAIAAATKMYRASPALSPKRYANL